MNTEDPNRYDDIIGLPHHVSASRPQMSMRNRAAQFSPFAALTGFGDVIDEAARLTDRRIELSEAEQAELNDALARLEKRLPADACVTYFVPDARKDGGRYVTETVRVRRILPAEGRLVLVGDRSIDLDCLLEVETKNQKVN